MKSELEAVGQVAFPTTYAGNDIWRDDVIHVDGIHSLAFGRVLDALDRLRNGVRVSNLVIQGRPGIGKSHFLGRVRHSVIEQGQIFVLFQPSTARRFWDSLAVAYLDALHREVSEDDTQLRTGGSASWCGRRRSPMFSTRRTWTVVCPPCCGPA